MANGRKLGLLVSLLGVFAAQSGGAQGGTGAETATLSRALDLEGAGKCKEAIPVLREAVREAPDQPMISVMLGHALIASEDSKNFDEAKQMLKNAVNRDNDNPFAWLQLGIVYDREGDQARAALATAERNNLQGNAKLALASARTAMRGIPQGTPDYLRAQDIAMVSEAELKKDKKGGMKVEPREPQPR